MEGVCGGVWVGMGGGFGGGGWWGGVARSVLCAVYRHIVGLCPLPQQ